MFPLRVTEELDDWPEKSVRRRLWVRLFFIKNDLLDSITNDNYILAFFVNAAKVYIYSDI